MTRGRPGVRPEAREAMRARRAEVEAARHLRVPLVRSRDRVEQVPDGGADDQTQVLPFQVLNALVDHDDLLRVRSWPDRDVVLQPVGPDPVEDVHASYPSG